MTTLHAPCLNPLDSFVEYTNLKLLRNVADGKEITMIGQDAGSIADAGNIFRIRQERVNHRLKVKGSKLLNFTVQIFSKEILSTHCEALYLSEALRKMNRSKLALATFEDFKYRDRLYFPELGFSVKKKFEWPEKEGLFRVELSNGKDFSLDVNFV